MFRDSKEANARHTPDGQLEDRFRCQVRDILDLDIFARDEQIYEELRRLKQLDEDVHAMEACTCEGGPQGEGLVSVPHEPHCPLSVSGGGR